MSYPPLAVDFPPEEWEELAILAEARGMDAEELLLQWGRERLALESQAVEAARKTAAQWIAGSTRQAGGQHDEGEEV